MLISKDSHGAAGAKQFYWIMETIRTIEHFHTSALTLPANIAINVGVTELLIDGPKTGVVDVMWNNLREHFPSADVAEENDDRPAIPQLLLEDVQPFGLKVLSQPLRWHRSHLDAANQVCSQPLKVAPSYSSQFPGRLFLSKGDLKITPRQPAIVREQQPCEQSHEVSQAKQEPQRKEGRDRRARAIQKVKAKIEHAVGRAVAGEFA